MSESKIETKKLSDSEKVLRGNASPKKAMAIELKEVIGLDVEIICRILHLNANELQDMLSTERTVKKAVHKK